ncbi:thermonuclease family protein [Marimonas arenosa]|uniref:Thermonuclease family protein n=1 Tax=Marimonas arenosa TaxID=1795305 RepID=A0AAE3WEX7_9RHOB|nr:thermonuclease family protein [Marimonas arenosa]MDQ2091467.1 thermonuclease family protein [Marimonas arenosa]
MTRRNNIFTFSRDYPRARKLDMGLPPRRPRRRNWRGKMGLFVAIAILSVAVFPSVIDAGLSLTKQNTGCRVWRIVDGDTVKLSCPTSGYGSGRLLGFDTPEYKARCLHEFVLAIRATYVLRWRFWTARRVSVTAVGRDKYDRRLVRMRLDGRDVGPAMIRAGYARSYAGGARDGWCL